MVGVQQAVQEAEQVVQQAAFQDWLPHSFVEIIRDLWERGLLPFKRVLVYVYSNPENARIFINSQYSGTTSAQGWLQEDYMNTIRLELDGYRPCRFRDGTYSEPAEGWQEYAVFNCEMIARHEALG